ncbi:MAG TPA: O-antigen ligase family protein [Pirellulales bacterium]|nr:O-antigen ligase family protein [Pirellulales bacterium]
METFVAVATLIGLIWGAALLLRGGPLYGALLVLLTGTCFGHPFLHVDTGFIPLTADRLLFLLVLALCATYRKLGFVAPKPLGKAEIVLAAFLCLLVVSTLLHDWRFQHNLPASKLLFYYLMPAGMYWLARQVPLSEAATRWVFGFLALLGMYLAGTAIAECLRWKQLVFPQYIASTEIHEFLGRGRGPLLNPAGNGYFLAIGLCAMWMGWPRLGWPGRLVMVALTALFVGGFYATLTRCVWMGALAMSLIVAWLVLPRSWRLPVVAGTLLAAMAIAASQWERLIEFKRDEGQSAREAAESARLRPVLGVVAWRMFLERPVFGCGFGHYRERFVDVLDDRSSDLPLDTSRRYVQHNVFLGLLTETGLTGTVLFMMLLGYWLREAWLLWRSSAPLWARQHGLLFLASMASYFANAMFQDLAIIPMVNMMLFFLAGLMPDARRPTPDARRPTPDA